MVVTYRLHIHFRMDNMENMALKSCAGGGHTIK